LILYWSYRTINFAINSETLQHRKLSAEQTIFLATATKCITDVINSQGHIVVDFADVSTVMRDGGVAILGNATASGEGRAYEAAEKALNSPLLNDSNIQGAKWVLLNINSAHGIYEHTLDEVEMIQAYIQEQAGEDCDVIFGTGFDDNLGESISVTIIATGFEYNHTGNAYTSKVLKPKEERDKIVVALGEVGAEEKLFDTIKSTVNKSPNSPQNVEEPIQITSIPTPEETKISSDPLAPVMIEVEPPAIPIRLAMGMRLPKPMPVIKVETIAPIVEELTLKIEEELPTEEKILFSLEDSELEKTPMPLPLVQDVDEKIIFELTPEVSKEITSTSMTAEEATAAENVQAELDAIFNRTMVEVQKSEQQMQDEFVTIKGITLNRKKGSRYLTDSELEAEVNFELQKRAFDERASKLRSMSFNVNKADIDSDDNNIPAYMRQNKVLDQHPASSEDVYSNVKVNSGNTNGSNIEYNQYFFKR
jgi:cell division protein FtsZ